MKKILLTSYIILQLLVSSVSIYGMPVMAAELPNADQLRQQIQQQVQQGIENGNNPSPTQAPCTENCSTPTPNDTNVTNTGDNAEVTDNNSSSTDTEINQVNNTEVDQNVKGKAITGENEASRNISIGGDAGVIHTGDAIMNVGADLTVGSNDATVGNNGNSAGGTSSVANTGDGLTVTKNTDGSTTTSINGVNNTIIHQRVDGEAVTGNNRADRNIAIGGGAAGVITTGDALINTNYMITANGNVALVGGNNGHGGPGAGASIYIINTGDSASGKFINSLRNSTTINQVNNLQVTQTCGANNSSEIDAQSERQPNGTCSAITGNNHSDRNIAFGADAGVINTGDAVVDVNLHVTGNHNQASSTGGNGAVGSSTNVANTGDNLDLDVTNTSEDDTTINQVNNARITQDIQAEAITGRNTANRNISVGGNAGIIRTGNAIINVNLDADLNTNDASVNNPSASLQAGAGSDNHIVNTGDDSTITTNTSTSRTTTINSVNNLAVGQAIRAYLETGNNSASKNIGGDGTSTITTGDSVLTVDSEVRGNTNDADPYIVPSCENGALVCTEVVPTPSVKTPENNTNNSTPPAVAQVAGESRSQGDAGQVLGAAVGSVLPATGAEDMYIVLISAVVLLAGGLTLRKYNSPSGELI